MLSFFLQEAGPAETTNYMILGYSFIFTTMLIYIVSLVARFRNLRQDIETLQELEHKDA